MIKQNFLVLCFFSLQLHFISAVIHGAAFLAQLCCLPPFPLKPSWSDKPGWGEPEQWTKPKCGNFPRHLVGEKKQKKESGQKKKKSLWSDCASSKAAASPSEVVFHALSERGFNYGLPMLIILHSSIGFFFFSGTHFNSHTSKPVTGSMAYYFSSQKALQEGLQLVIKLNR